MATFTLFPGPQHTAGVDSINLSVTSPSTVKFMPAQVSFLGLNDGGTSSGTTGFGRLDGRCAPLPGGYRYTAINSVSITVFAASGGPAGKIMFGATAAFDGAWSTDASEYIIDGDSILVGITSLVAPYGSGLVAITGDAASACTITYTFSDPTEAANSDTWLEYPNIFTEIGATRLDGTGSSAQIIEVEIDYEYESDPGLRLWRGIVPSDGHVSVGDGNPYTHVVDLQDCLNYRALPDDFGRIVTIESRTSPSSDAGALLARTVMNDASDGGKACFDADTLSGAEYTEADTGSGHRYEGCDFETVDFQGTSSVGIGIAKTIRSHAVCSDATVHGTSNQRGTTVLYEDGPSSPIDDVACDYYYVWYIPDRGRYPCRPADGATAVGWLQAGSSGGCPPCGGGSALFEATGARETFTVPEHEEGTMTVTMAGAGGGSAFGGQESRGGQGGGFVANLDLPAGTVVGVEVGEAGGSANKDAPYTSGLGGWPDGAQGGGNDTNEGASAGGGGGSTRLYLGSTLLAVAGGGGGGGSNYGVFHADAGGDGGQIAAAGTDAVGGDALALGTGNLGGGGQGGTLAAGGAGGIAAPSAGAPVQPGDPGSLLAGGEGGRGARNTDGGGGGGGGGLFGGGGGGGGRFDGGGGGGGGSSQTDGAIVTVVASTGGSANEDGFVLFEWDCPE